MQHSYMQHHRPHRRASTGSITRRVGAVGLLIVGVVIFFAGISWFRRQAPAPVKAASNVATNDEATITPTGETPVRRDREETTLYNVGHAGLATATRQVDDHLFHHTILAHLSDPPAGEHYQCWLLRDEPFDFFTTGSMTKNADGTYALVWDGPFGKDFEDYSAVVVTLEKDGGDPGPSAHVLEGKFGQ